MIGKSLLAAAALAATMTLAMPATEAKADVDVDIGIGFGGYVPGYYGGGYGHGYGYDHDDYGYGHYPVHRPKRISCGTGRRIVDNSGFNRVRAVDCDLPGYRYTAHKKGHKYMVRVNGRGVITGVNRVY
jgi:hypothetical protein